jgi:hypothetical protein
MEAQNICGYCGEPKPVNRTWHSCGKAQAAKLRLGEVMRETRERQIGGPEFFGTPDEVRRLQTMKTGAHVAGVKTKPIGWIKDVR